MSLANIDGEVADRERNYIVNLGRAHGLYPDEVVPLLGQKHDMLVPSNLSKDEKFDVIFSLVQLMKVDERMYKEEIQFCSQVASRLGYDQQVMFDLMLMVKSGHMDKHEMADLKAITQKHLK